MRRASVIASWICVCVGLAPIAGCMRTRAGDAEPPVVTAQPDDFVLRDVRQDAAARMGCQAPMVLVRTTTWAGSEGNVLASGCGQEITYYLRCLTNHQCSVLSRD